MGRKVFIGDTGSNRIRMADPEQDITYTIAGNGGKGCSGDNGRALDACLNAHGLRIDADNNLYFVDFHNHIIRVIKF
jgi:hypothetical protein